MQRRLLLAPLAMGLLILTGCDWDEFSDSARHTVDFHHSYPIKPGGRLSLENFNGSIEIAGWNDNSVDISGTKYGPTPELRDAVKIDIVTTADTVSIRTIRPAERRGNLGARYVIKVPKNIVLERIVSSNGAIRVSDVDGAARLRTSNGAVRAVNVAGGLEATTSNGGVELQGVAGGATVRTSNGRIRVEGLKGWLEAATTNGGINADIVQPDDSRALKLSTSNGSVELRLPAAFKNDVRVNTSNGGITLSLPAAFNGRVRAHTNGNSVSTDFDVKTVGEIGKGHLEGNIGNGGGLLDLETSNGSIRILKF